MVGLKKLQLFLQKITHYWGMSKEKTGTIIKCISVKKNKKTNVNVI